MRILKPLWLLLLLAVALVFPLLFPNPTVTTMMIFALLFAAIATGWNIISGYTGYVALGHTAFFGIGAYALALMCQDWHIPGGYEPFYLVPVAGLVVLPISAFFGWIALRVRRHTFIVITIAMFFVVQLLAYNLRFITNGSTGLSLPLPTDWSGDFYNIPFYYVTLLLLLISLAVSWWIRNSKFGLGLLAIRDDEDRAMGLGVRTNASKLAAFIISAVIVGMAGAIWAYFVESIYPASTFDPNFDVAMALMAFLGGLGTLSGPVLGALIVELAQQYFTIQYGQNGYYLIVYGALFLIVIIFMPRGIIPTARDLWRKYHVARSQQVVEVNLATTPAASKGVSTDTEKKEGINL